MSGKTFHVVWILVSSSLLGKMVCSPAVSYFPLYKSTHFPSYTLQQNVTEAKPPRVILQLEISLWLLCPSPTYSKREVFVSAIAFVKGWF